MKKITTAFFKAKNKTENRRKHLMKIMMFLVVSFMGIEGVLAQTTIARQDFETSPATPTVAFATSNIGTPGASTGFSTGTSGGSNVSPTNANLFSEGTRGYRIQGGTGTVGRILTFADVNSTGYTGVSLSFRLAGMSLGSTGNGMDSTVDEVLVEVSPDGGTTYYQQAKVNSSASNVRWIFGATGSGTRAYAANNTLTTYSSTANVLTGTGNTAISTVTITNLPAVANLKIRISAQCDAANESWILDDVRITGSTVVAPTITNVNPTASTTVLATNNNIFAVIATNNPTAFEATNLPTGLAISNGGVISGTPATGTAGSYTVGLTARNAGGTSANVNLNLTINKINQTITFTPTLSNKVVDDTPINLTATASSGLLVSYESSNNDVAFLADNTLSFFSAGTATITASQAGNVDYNPAPNVTQDQVVTAAALLNQTISFTLASPVTYGASPITLTATATSGLTVSYSSSDPTIASISGTTLTILKAGSVTITASQSGDSSYNPAPNATQNLVINAKALTITGATASDKVYNGTAAATITGATLSGIVGADNVALSAAGATFASANVATGIAVTTNYTLINSTASNYTVSQPSGLTASITQASQSITFGALANKTTADIPYSAGAISATSGVNALAYTSSNTNVATINATTGLITIVGAGITTITVSQPGNINYTAAANETQVLTVTLAPVALIAFDFAGATGSETSINSTANVANIATSTITRGAGLTAGSNAERFNATSWAATSIANAVSGDDYMEFTVTPNSGYQFSVSSMLFQIQRSNSGLTAIALRSSLDNYAANLDSDKTVTDNTSTQSFTFTFAQANTSGPVTYRLYGFAEAGTGTGGPGDGTGNDIVVTGTVSCATPAAPTVSDSNVTYDGAAKSVTASVGASTTVDWYAAATAGSALSSGSLTSPTNTNAGTYTYYAEARNTVCGAVSASRTMVTVTINKANATLSVSNPLVLFSGSAQSATVNSAVAGTVSNILTGGAATQSALGTYAVTADFLPNNTDNYNTLTGASAGNFVISDTSTWNGTTWSLDLPTPTMNAVIAANYGTNNGQINVKNLTVNNGARFTVNAGANGATISGNITNNGFIVVENNGNLIQTATGADDNTSANDATVLVHRNSNSLFRLDYTLWSSPVSGSQTLGGFSPLTTPSRNYEYLPGSDKYRSVGNEVTFTTGKGYLIRMPDALSNAVGANLTDYYKGLAPLTYEGGFSGTKLNNGLYTITTTPNTFNAVGNPYPSTISADAFLAANSTDGTLYFWRKTNGVGAAGTAYAQYTRLGGTATISTVARGGITPDGTIQVGQGFIVKATGNSLVFNNTMRATPSSSQQFFKTKKADVSRVWLNLNNAEGMINQTLVGYLDNATLGVDNGIDGKSFGDGAIELASSIDGESYIIQGRPAFDATDVVALNFKTNVAGTYNIAIDKLDGVFANGQTIVYLVDKNTGIATNLNEGAYTFTAQAGADNTRFTLTYQKTLKVDAPLFSENSVLVSRNNGTLNVKSTAVAINNVKVFDVQGRLVAERKNVKSNTANISNLRTNQVLIVKVTAENNAVVTKKVLN